MAAASPSLPAPIQGGAGVDARRSKRRVALVLLGATAAVLLVGAATVIHAERAVNHVALGGSPRPVTVVAALDGAYRAHRLYVGRVDPWIEADVGPQFLAAYVLSVSLRPGAAVTRGQVLATLDCSNAHAEMRAAAMQARAIQARKRALSDEARRKGELLEGGFIAQNDVEVTGAQDEAEGAQLLSMQARVSAAQLFVDDCVLRAPFDGEVATRMVDPGAFVRPGSTILSIVDRNTVRVTADAPEADFDAAGDGVSVRIHLTSASRRLVAPISRRSPKADPRTRTVHFEVDVPDPTRALAVGTTAIVELDVGAPTPAVVVPLYAATIRAGKAHLFVVEGGLAHAREVAEIGEGAGSLYLDPTALPAGAHVVVEGAALLSDGDPVIERLEAAPAPSTSASRRGGGYGRPL